MKTKNENKKLLQPFFSQRKKKQTRKGKFPKRKKTNKGKKKAKKKRTEKGPFFCVINTVYLI